MIVQVRGFQTVLHRDSILVHFGTKPMLNGFARQLLPALTPLILVVLLTPRAAHALGLDVVSQERNLLAESFVFYRESTRRGAGRGDCAGLGIFDAAVSSP